MRGRRRIRREPGADSPAGEGGLHGSSATASRRQHHERYHERARSRFHAPEILPREQHRTSRSERHVRSVPSRELLPDWWNQCRDSAGLARRQSGGLRRRQLARSSGFADRYGSDTATSHRRRNSRAAQAVEEIANLVVAKKLLMTPVSFNLRDQGPPGSGGE